MVIGTPTVLNLIPGGVMKVIHVNQVNENIEIQFRIMNGAQPFNVPEGVSCTIRGTKGDNFGYAAAVAVTAGSNIVTVTLTEQLTAVAGAGNIFELVFVGASDDMKVSTENFLLDVERAALGEDTVISDSDLAYADQVLDQLQSVGAVNAQVQQNKANIAAEITRATAAEQTLQQNINAEAAARQAADNTLQSNINAEASSRATTDASLQSQINQLVAPSGSAPSAAEVENARIGSDGTVYPTLGDAIRTQNSLLKSQLEASYSVRGVEWDIGGLSIGAGTNITSTNRIRTSLLNNVILAQVSTGYAYAIYAYSANETYVGAWNGSEWVTAATGIWHSKDIVIPALPNGDAYGIRFVLKRTDEANMSVSEGSNLTICCVTDITLSQKDKAADAYITGKEVKRIDGAFESLAVDGTIRIYELNDINELTEKRAINGAGDVVEQIYSYCTIQYIDMANNAVDLYGSVELITNVNFYQYIAVYDSNKTFLTRYGGYNQRTVMASHNDIPSNAKYIRWSLTAVNIGNVASCSLRQVYPIDYLKASPENKWYVLGDSISAGYYSMTESMAQAAGVTMTYTSPVTTESGEVTGSVWDRTLSHNYWNYANQWKLKRNLVGLAYPAQGYLHTAANNLNGIGVVSSTDFSDAGLITVAWGFNDWHYNMTRGNHDLIDASVPYPGENYDTTQITTINQAIWFCLGELIRQAPNAKIVVQTPMNGWAYGGDFASNWGIGTAKSNSGTLADIHDDIVYWANYYGLQILDMTYNNSIVNRRNIKDTLIDGSHPSDAAHQQLGRHVAMFLGYC